MTTVHTNVASRRSSPYSTGGVPEAEIDQSTRVPVLFFVGKALFWLILSSLLGLTASLKLHWPDFLGGVEYLTYGRVEAAFKTAFLYGWASSAAFAVGLWLMARLSQNRLVYGSLLLVAGAFWNIGVLIAIVGIFAGETSGYSGFPLPGFAGPILFVAYLLVGAWSIMTFFCRQYRTTYVSQWYLLAAFFWFPWLLTVAHGMLIAAPVRGTVQAIVNAWYGSNFLMLWLAPVALAAIYYFLPKILGRPIRYYYLATIAFWSYALIAPWVGVARLTSGPVPAWISTIGIVASALLLVPVAIISINIHGVSSATAGARGTVTLAFIRIASVVFTLLFLIGAILSFRNFQEVIQFTHVNSALWFAGIYAFFSMSVFGAAYFFLPRVFRREWETPSFIGLHFWTSLIGALLIIAGLVIAGWIQGGKMNDPSVPFVEVTQATLPWLAAVSLGWMVLLVGHIAFAWNVTNLALSRSISSEGEKILLSNPPEMKVRAQTT